MASSGRDVSRRTWDKEAFAARAAARAAATATAGETCDTSAAPAAPRIHQDGDPFAPTRAWLTKRARTLDLDAKVGTSEIVGSAQAGGFACAVCRVTLKDSSRYLAHMNSRAHQKMLGVSMRVRRSSAEEVWQAFRKEKERWDRREGGGEGGSLAERVQRRKDERRRERERERVKETKMEMEMETETETEKRMSSIGK